MISVKSPNFFSRDYILGLPTNAVASESQVGTTKKYISLVNIGFEGPRSITSQVRGNYFSIMKGIFVFINSCYAR
jgi:hypothetical protein